MNAVPGTNSYKPMPSYQAVTDPLAARALGAIDVRDKSNNAFQFAGTAAGLFGLSGTTWIDRSKGGGYATAAGEAWEFVLWKNRILATNFSNPMQFIELGGTQFADLHTTFQARHIAVIGDYVVAGNTTDATDGVVPDRLRTSRFNDETNWIPSSTLGSIARDLKGGAIQRIFGGEYGVVLGEAGTYRMDFVGAPTWFDVPLTLPEIGLIAPGAAARIGDSVYAWSNQGFVAIKAGTGWDPIGAGKVDRFAFKDLDQANLDRISAVSDPRGGRIFWAYPGSGSSNGVPNKILCYDRNFGRWSCVEQDLDILWRAGGIGFTLEGLDALFTSIDDMTVSLDSTQWQGNSTVLLAGFNSAHRHGFFDGSALPATIETRELELGGNGYESLLLGLRSLVDAGTVTVQIGTRRTQSDPVVWGPITSPTSFDNSLFKVRNKARYFRFRLNISGDWTDALGVEIARDHFKLAGRRG